MAVREKGYYWVKTENNGSWLVAWWGGYSWYIFGIHKTVSDEELVKINKEKINWESDSLLAEYDEKREVWRELGRTNKSDIIRKEVSRLRVKHNFSAMLEDDIIFLIEGLG